mmetsp:Transcript_65253/g.132581  ORF Transcript_65253/g.132581 Transcript_65253/m.132581 type:complete len:132 (-) Transcript_65253:47-442(-)
MAVPRRSSLVLKVLLIVAFVAANLAFVGPARGGQRQLAPLRAAETKAEQAVEEAKEENVLDDWFSTDPTSGGITWLWILVPGAILFYVYLDLVYGERCISSYLNVSGEFCYREQLPTAFEKLATKVSANGA